MSYRLGVDVGGTFTDLLLFDEQSSEIRLGKVPTTKNQAEGILNGIVKIAREAEIAPTDIAFFMHGTTAATNAILEKKGVITALITTAGFRDVLHIMRQNRPKLYDFFARRPEPLVPRRLRFEIPERILHTGEIERELDEERLATIVRRIRREKVQALAVCLLHSYANPVHELKIKATLERECPDVDVSISFEVLPEIREYERMSTTVINAYVQPIIEKYLRDLEQRLAQVGVQGTVHIMQSNGGIMPSTVAGQKSAATILSGPAAGVLGGVAIARRAGQANVITVDMGGTSFDICLAHEGEPKYTAQSEIAGHALKIPMLDIHTIGAGGGSIAWIDAGGVLKVGPHSAGADPGPACYVKGGREPTVTDANLVLGRLNPDYFLGGEMQIDEHAARQAIAEKCARPLGMAVNEVAEGIIRVVNASMVKGIRYVSVEKGYDPRDFSLICFGGNGPLHAVELATELSIPQVIIPFAPGVNCAYGLLTADFRYDYTRTYLKRLAQIDLTHLNALLDDMEQNGRQRMRADGVRGANILISHALDLRYVGQGYELEVAYPNGRFDRQRMLLVERRFHELHQSRYGFSAPEEPTEVVNVKMACIGQVPRPELKVAQSQTREEECAPKNVRNVYLKGGLRRTPVYDRSRLKPGISLSGPAIIEQKDSTTLLLPGDQARIDGYRNVVVTVAASAASPP